MGAAPQVGEVRQVGGGALCPIFFSLIPHQPPPDPPMLQIIEKRRGHIRSRVFREVEMLYQCQGHRYGGGTPWAPHPKNIPRGPTSPDRFGLWGLWLFGFDLSHPMGGVLWPCLIWGSVLWGGRGGGTLMAPNSLEALGGKRGSLAV